MPHPEQILYDWLFEEEANDPLAWQLSSRRLACAANSLAERSLRQWNLQRSWVPGRRMPWDVILTVHAPALMLYGFAVENILKALFIAQGQAATTKGRVSKNLITHDLLKLATRTSLPLTPRESEVLDRLSHFISAEGRYPVGILPDNPERKLIPHEEDPEIALAVIERADENLRKLTRALPPCDIAQLCRKSLSDE